MCQTYRNDVRHFQKPLKCLQTSRKLADDNFSKQLVKAIKIYIFKLFIIQIIVMMRTNKRITSVIGTVRGIPTFKIDPKYFKYTHMHIIFSEGFISKILGVDLTQNIYK